MAVQKHEMQNADTIERSLKCQIIRFREESDDRQATIGIFSRQMALHGASGVLSEAQIWDITLKTAMWKSDVPSASVGVLTKIGDYTNKAGKTFKAHFTENGRFVEKCKSEDERPKSYTGNFCITRERFVFRRMENPIQLADLFVGRWAEQAEDEEPLAAVAKRASAKNARIADALQRIQQKIDEWED